MDCKQRTTDKLLQTLAVCLQWESLIRDGNIFLSQKINSNTQNFDKSKLSPTQDNKAIAVNNSPLDKNNRESINDNTCNSNEWNKIPDQKLFNKIENDNSKDHNRINKNPQNNNNSFGNSGTTQYDISRSDINNENVWKPSSTNRVYIVGDSIVKHVNRYDISRKTETSKVFVRLSHDATVRSMTDDVIPVLRNNFDHIVFHIRIYDVPSNKIVETTEKYFLDHIISLKSTTCDVSISNILIREYKYQ